MITGQALENKESEVHGLETSNGGNPLSLIITHV